ncbi:MAG: Ldh family oxidoreductase [Hyphomicrobiaceae bacterium]
MSETAARIPTRDLEQIVVRALERADTSPANAASVARALVAAEVDGQAGHGLSRVASYAAQARSGKVDGRAVPAADRTRPATLVVDAAHGFAYPALDLAVSQLPGVAREAGIGAASIHRSHHAGALGLVAERLAEVGLVALVLANTPSAMAAWGGRRPLLGTNPIAFAAPRANSAPLVVDLALSEVARGKIAAAARRGEPIPLGWATDKAGQPTTDAKAALEGTLAPAGGAKGAALALMVEILCAAVTGASYAHEATSFLDAKGGPPGTGQLIIALDAVALGGEASADRVALLTGLVEAEPGVRVPGARREARRAEAASSGVAVAPGLLEELRALAG